MDKETPPDIVLLPDGTVYANIAAVSYNPGNGMIQLQAAETREWSPAFGKSYNRVFEVGRFSLTPRALRQLIDSIALAQKRYEVDCGPLPTLDQFIARAAMDTLPPFTGEKPPDPPKS